LKQKKLSVLDKTGFYFRIGIRNAPQPLSEYVRTHAEKETRYIQYDSFFCFNSTASYTEHNS
jgi:hypothetical protein